MADFRRLSTRFHRAGSIGGASQFTIQPGFGCIPIAHHRSWRGFQHFRRLFNAESTEEAHLHDLHLALIDPGQLVEGVVQQR